ncbi:zinc transport system ATP-binding protein [Thermosyntropha lipolytica DSM 11003]|uniref:Zinc transport system ATP-binding protein n=1 Tax=Thermosyntropha lipolytica DSM 11003 TaxID=1123382 RepID=A0A1M5JGK8_9FIRM|nr:ABC transporter ATP-binding protein [Thermosyntropha lipolytica]SHG39651.1 zinc transport system ATP-binding protein [Thermosyntropha lipolytica DSM 11003]
MEKETTAVEIKNLWVKINGRSILEDVNLKIKEKDFLGIIGPNGGGKTTLLKVIAGLIKPYRGEIRVMGEDRIRPGYIGYVPQYAYFDYEFPITVEEVVLSGRLKHKKGRRFSAADYRIAHDKLKQVEMYSFRKRQIGELSGGERQRVLVARALAVEPKILLLDEPTASADKGFVADFYELLCELNREMTIILVSHDITAVSRYVKTLACMNRTLYYNEDKILTYELMEKVYPCPVDLIAHGIPHRVLMPHEGVVGER